uniref:60S ribosomal protein L41 n=1 Tax=Salix viminalis TaxID=40686 RepID=A0A6N2K728_SALVM
MKPRRAISARTKFIGNHTPIPHPGFRKLTLSSLHSHHHESQGNLKSLQPNLNIVHSIALIDLIEFWWKKKRMRRLKRKRRKMRQRSNCCRAQADLLQCKWIGCGSFGVIIGARVTEKLLRVSVFSAKED